MISDAAKRRFVAKLVADPATGCHLWTAYRNPAGYGQVRIRSAAKSALLTHRVAWMIAHGHIPDGQGVLHRCDNPPCCNPEHLFLGDQAANQADMAAKGRHPRNRTDYLPRGRDHHMYEVGMKINRQIAEAIRKATGTNKEIGRRFGVDPSLVSRIKTRKIWR